MLEEEGFDSRVCQVCKICVSRFFNALNATQASGHCAPIWWLCVSLPVCQRVAALGLALELARLGFAGRPRVGSETTCDRRAPRADLHPVRVQWAVSCVLLTNRKVTNGPSARRAVAEH